MNRRKLLKMFLSAPAIFSSRLLPSGIFFYSGPCQCINIILHGLFFMEFQNDALVAASPIFNDHQFLYRDHGSWQLNPASGIVNLKNGPGPNLTAGPKNKFPSGILQFSRKIIQADQTVPFFVQLDNVQRYAFVLILPWPTDIIPLRQGNLSDFHMVNGGKVASSIANLTGSQAAIIVRLKYDLVVSPPFSSRNFYAEHCCPTGLGGVKKALAAAANAAAPAYTFDLDLDAPSTSGVGLDKPGDLPDEMCPDDEISLQEGNPCLPCPQKRAVDVTTCPIFGVTP